MKAKTAKVVSIAVSAVILAIVLVLNIAVAIFSGELDQFVVGYKGGGSIDGGTRAAGKELSESIQAEGTVLVQNKDNVLPLSKTEVPQVNVFGWASVDWVLSGSGSGQVKRYGSTDLYGALTEYGIEYNQELKSMYTNFRANREFSKGGSHAGSDTDGNPGSGSLHSFNYQFSRLYEPDIEDRTQYTTDLLANAKNYSDTALVVIGRVSGESNDSPKVQYKNVSGTALPDAAHTDTTRTYLEISTEEEALLSYVGANYDKVIVLINSTNVMELGFMENIDGLDSCLVVASTGTAGALAIPKILYGEINPSGRLADTYAYDLSTSSTYVDTGSGSGYGNEIASLHFYTDGNGLYPTTTTHTNGNPSSVSYNGVAYQDYRESIYVGYKWYETADTEGFWNSSYAKDKWNISNGYDDVVQYPFGYGLSYEGTEFSWEIRELNFANNQAVGKDDTLKIGVRVTNIGTVAGRDVVELYYTAPYTANGIEKSSVNLAAFAKTQQILKPGDHEDVILEVNVADMASYDCYEKVIPGGGYVLESGNYTLTLRTDAHNKAGNKVQGGVYGNDTLTVRISSDTRVLEEAQNRFTGENTTDGVAIDGNSDGTAEITYLSRGNFSGTFPGEPSEDRAMDDRIKALNLYTRAMADAWATKHSDAEPVTFGSGEKMLVYENGAINDLGRLLGTDYNAEEWEDLLDHITKNEMTTLVLNGYTKTSPIASIGKPATIDLDGPNQLGSFSTSITDIENATGFSSIVLAQTWNTELAYSMGLTIGSECIAYRINGWYGPGVNLHRSPFGGRNYEYYSEDSYLTGIMCANVVTASKNKGVFCYLKHVCLYEGESGRDGMYTWVTEQALREIYLKPFEISVKVGGSNAIMTSYGRIGAVWTGGSEALLQEVITDEWGFQGAFLTDYSDHVEFMDADAMIRAGGDLFMRVGGGSFDYETSSNAFNQALRSSTKDLVYMWLNSLATNAQYNDDIRDGKISDKIEIPVTAELNFRWYIPVLIGIDVIAVAGCGAWITLSLLKKDGKKSAE